MRWGQTQVCSKGQTSDGDHTDGCESKPCTPGEHQNRWQMDDHPPAPWPCLRILEITGCLLTDETQRRTGPGLLGKDQDRRAASRGKPTHTNRAIAKRPQPLCKGLRKIAGPPFCVPKFASKGQCEATQNSPVPCATSAGVLLSGFLKKPSKTSPGSGFLKKCPAPPSGAAEPRTRRAPCGLHAAEEGGVEHHPRTSAWGHIEQDIKALFPGMGRKKKSRDLVCLPKWSSPKTHLFVFLFTNMVFPKKKSKVHELRD